MWKELLRAAKFARHAHGEAKRAHGAPYYKHPMAVARLLWNKGCNTEKYKHLLMAAYLHDTMEDCEVTTFTLALEFSVETARLVKAVSKVKGEAHEAAYRRIKAAGSHAVALKLADREHNNSELVLAPEHLVKLREKAKFKTDLMNKVFFEDKT